MPTCQAVFNGLYSGTHVPDPRRTATDPVRNGNRWRVYAVDPQHQRIAARRIGDGARAAFGGEYLREHVHHGYAVAVHAAQGVTAQTTHAVLGESIGRAAAYVALTRGRDTNTAYLYDTIGDDGDYEHAEPATRVHTPRRGDRRAAAALLRSICGRDERAQTVMAAAADTDRAQLPPLVRGLLRRHEHTRAVTRAHYRSQLAAHTEHHGYDLAADLPQLRAEVDYLGAAGVRSPAAMYTAPDTATAALDDDSRRAVTQISYSAQAVQVLQFHNVADKRAILQAFAVTAHHNQRNVLAVPATDEAMADLTAARYADAATRPDTAQHNLQTGH